MKKLLLYFFMMVLLLLSACSSLNPSTSKLSDNSQNAKVKSNFDSSTPPPTPTPSPNPVPTKEELMEQGSAKADTFYLELLIQNYEQTLIDAINNNDFSLVEPSLIPESNLYNSQKQLISNLNKKNIKEKLIEYSIEDIKVGKKSNEYQIYVEEKISITYPDRINSETKVFKWVYTAVLDKKVIGLTEINEWK
ncbi:hypothetical protein ACFQI7_32625 [Paenibacillus allorhizosphaerae]|uniref:TcaA NTF2-like domain-containing protein n=2 Tax=Paenibacillus allorhizosphaerae TaxID=2849866 RepID=UPI00360D171C